MTNFSDDDIRREWTLAVNLKRAGDRAAIGYRPTPPPNLGHRLADSIVSRLEASGVTEADIDRLFPISP